MHGAKDARGQNHNFLQPVVGTVLEDADFLLCSDHNSIMIKSSEMRKLECDHVPEEVVDFSLMAHNMSLCTRNILNLKKQCTTKEISQEGGGVPPTGVLGQNGISKNAPNLTTTNSAPNVLQNRPMKVRH